MSETGQSSNNQFTQIKRNVEVRLLESGDKYKLKHVVKAKLQECGWWEEMTTIAREKVRSEGDIQTNPQLLTDQLLNTSLENLPDNAKVELLEKIRDCIATNLNK
ncbi:hypothetical protein CONCODRAFT_144680 [Conidiobolus coronatus NRRL 28638]|uniref:Transcription and mRNA export factor SUS1 n=1 Tax=Conidiobolus coronatus (strain ATCC 28846 / CBS 209.66 / NRRL 28638) TaxID=796925 RepID=A0A137PHX2_CONC2|nr:hypothetical protein CONCODRAFT_144680 [Conidiobolus coronatus NRRL 28638]|eukprot:KXN74597.1 hypothetical protein CONCODRAFT_144680 [Conidiobolus coronatus NRRL 28638]